MSLLFRSSLALIMGILGPAMVAGAWWESRRGHKRSEGARWEEYREQYSLWLQSKEASRQKIQRDALAAQPGLLGRMRDPFWRDNPGALSALRIGTGWWTPTPQDPGDQEAVPGMPALVAAGEGIALVGPESLMPVWRLVLALWISASTMEQREALPEGLGEGSPLPKDFRGPSRVVWVSSIDDVPGDCPILMTASGVHHVQLRDAEGATRLVAPDRLSSSDFAWVARRLAAPISSGEGNAVHDYTRRDQLLMDIGDRAPWDLVQQGPHGVVWGSTGSGKSVTVSAMVWSLVHRYSPERLVCLVIDFKGGAGLAPLVALPHTVGFVTDLDPARASRALEGITREMEARERLLLDHQVSNIALLPELVHCPRLVIALDEAAWLLGNFPEWAGVLADVMARGRSLGIHVLIATQRIQGVLSPAMMANVSLRVCGRVSDEGEVTAWIPGLSRDRVAALRCAPPGRVLAMGAHRSATNVTVTPPDITTIPGDQPSGWRVWAEELPSRHRLTPGSWGLLDDTMLRCHRRATFDPGNQGSVLVVGDSGSGKTTALAALASQCSEVVMAPVDPLSLFLLLLVRGEPGMRTLVIDDVDDLLTQSGPEGAPLLLEHLAAWRGVTLMSTHATSPALRPLSRIAPTMLTLSVAHPENSMTWGAPGKSAPGRGTWEGMSVQVSQGGVLPPPHQHCEKDPPESLPIIVSRSPEEWAGVDTEFLGRPSDLFSAWSSLVKRIEKHPVIIDRVAPLELRQATAGYLIVPPIAPPEGAVMLWERGELTVIRRERWQH